MTTLSILALAAIIGISVGALVTVLSAAIISGRVSQKQVIDEPMDDDIPVAGSPETERN